MRTCLAIVIASSVLLSSVVELHTTHLLISHHHHHGLDVHMTSMRFTRCCNVHVFNHKNSIFINPALCRDYLISSPFFFFFFCKRYAFRMTDGWVAIVSDRKSQIAPFPNSLARCPGSLDSACSCRSLHLAHDRLPHASSGSRGGGGRGDAPPVPAKKKKKKKKKKGKREKRVFLDKISYFRMFCKS